MAQPLVCLAGVAGDGASSENGRVGSDKSHSANSDTCPLLQQS